MKKVLCGLLVVLVMVGVCLAEGTIYKIKSTHTSDALVENGRGILGGIIIVTDGTNACTVSIYDNTAASGDKFFPTIIVPASYTSGFAIGVDTEYYNGIYVDITTSGTCTYTVLRNKKP